MGPKKTLYIVLLSYALLLSVLEEKGTPTGFIEVENKSISTKATTDSLKPSRGFTPFNICIYVHNSYINVFISVLPIDCRQQPRESKNTESKNSIICLFGFSCYFDSHKKAKDVYNFKIISLLLYFVFVFRNSTSRYQVYACSIEMLFLYIAIALILSHMFIYLPSLVYSLQAHSSRNHLHTIWANKDTRMTSRGPPTLANDDLEPTVHDGS